jgi:DNA processing protein
MIVSGLAFGIDICAHRSALSNNLPTVGVVAHGLDKLYPSEHKHVADKMLSSGGLITEFMSETKMNPEYFPRRNRIIAGLSDATIVVEAGVKSGALITAEIANSYNRDVFAVPGRLDDSSSEGCNLLIKFNKAALIQSAEDVIRAMRWDVDSKKPKYSQQELFARLSADEECLVNIMRQKEMENPQRGGKVHIDELCNASGMPMSKVASLLLNMEFSGVIKSLPGKMYMLSG